MSLAYASYVDSITEEAARLADAVMAGPEKALACCPGWSAGDLLGHLEGIYRFWFVQLEAADAEERTEAPDGAPGGVEGFEKAVTDVARLLDEVGPNAPCWNWAGEDPTAEFVARRLALETAVHRVDAERAQGDATPIEAELAADGIEERIELFVRRKVAQMPTATLGGTLCLIANDLDAAFVIDVERGRVRWRRGRGPADAVLVGGASDLYLFTWNRVDLEAFEVTGNRDVAAAWAALPS